MTNTRHLLRCCHLLKYCYLLHEFVDRVSFETRRSKSAGADGDPCIVDAMDGNPGMMSRKQQRQTLASSSCFAWAY
jgi:hypothetical protein